MVCLASSDVRRARDDCCRSQLAVSAGARLEVVGGDLPLASVAARRTWSRSAGLLLRALRRPRLHHPSTEPAPRAGEWVHEMHIIRIRANARTDARTDGRTQTKGDFFVIVFFARLA